MNRYIYIVIFVVLMSWSTLAYAMMGFFSLPTIQSLFHALHYSLEKKCCPSFMLLCNCVIILWSYAWSSLVRGIFWFDLCLLLLLSCCVLPRIQKGWSLCSLWQLTAIVVFTLLQLRLPRNYLYSLSQAYFHLCTLRPLNFTVNTSDCNYLCCEENPEKATWKTNVTEEPGS